MNLLGETAAGASDRTWVTASFFFYRQHRGEPLGYEALALDLSGESGSPS
jgi:hypothetical protein